MARTIRILKYFRLAFVLATLFALALGLYTLVFFRGRAHFDLITVELFDSQSVSTFAFRGDGTGFIQLAGKSEIPFSFDPEVAHKALYRASRARKHTISCQPAGSQRPASLASRERGRYVLRCSAFPEICFLGEDRIHSAQDLFRDSLGLGDWHRQRMYTEGVVMTLSSTLLSCISSPVREQVAQTLEADGAPTIDGLWLREPLAPLAEIAPDTLLTPPAWSELQRATSPDGVVDAVLVERFGPIFGDPRQPELNQTSLYFVPKGEAVDDALPYRYKDTYSYAKRDRQVSPFMMLGPHSARILWCDSFSLVLYVGDSGLAWQQREQTLKSVDQRTVELLYLPSNSH